MESLAVGTPGQDDGAQAESLEDLDGGDGDVGLIEARERILGEKDGSVSLVG